MPRARGRALCSLAAAVAAGDVVLDRSADRHETRACTARAARHRAMDRGLHRASRLGRSRRLHVHRSRGPARAGQARLRRRRPRQTNERAEAWRPWRSYALMHVWMTLSEENSMMSIDRRSTPRWARWRSPRRRAVRSRTCSFTTGRSSTTGPRRALPRAVLVEAKRQLEAYFAGDLKEFSLPLAAERHRLPAPRLGRAGGDPVRRDGVVRRGRARRSGCRLAHRERSAWPTAPTRSRSWCRATV